ncbi:MAG TPA: hypothetical protein DCS81_04005 [Pantoea septica]|nr:hypothetical protein [Pantoea septica]
MMPCREFAAGRSFKQKLYSCNRVLKIVDAGFVFATIQRVNKSSTYLRAFFAKKLTDFSCIFLYIFSIDVQLISFFD